MTEMRPTATLDWVREQLRNITVHLPSILNKASIFLSSFRYSQGGWQWIGPWDKEVWPLRDWSTGRVNEQYNLELKFRSSNSKSSAISVRCVLYTPLAKSLLCLFIWLVILNMYPGTSRMLGISLPVWKCGLSEGTCQLLTLPAFPAFH